MPRTSKAMVQAKRDRWFNPEGLAVIAEMVAMGHTYKAIERRLKMPADFIYNAMRDMPEVAKVLTEAREQRIGIDYKVENAILKSALGASYTDTTVISRLTDEGMVEIERRVTTKKFTPNIGAAIFWLTNRKNGTWKRNPDWGNEAQEHGVNIKVIPVSSEEEIVDAEYEIMDEG